MQGQSVSLTKSSLLLQCPVCYQSLPEEIFRKVCENGHRICEKCVFNLRKRQCPICKIDFRIQRMNNKHLNGIGYQIIYREQDRAHNVVAIEQDIQQQHEAIRNYQRYLQQIQAYNNYYRNYYQSYYHQQYNNHHPQQMIHHQYPYQHYHNPHYHIAQQYPTNHQILNQQELSSQRQIDDREVEHQLRRIQRRLRDQEMYRLYARPDYIQSSQQQIYEQAESQTIACDLFAGLGQLLIRIGQKLSGRQSSLNHSSK